MEGIRPPPNASPVELRAWQDMMDSMVTFIKAATNLMTAVTSRVDISVKPSRVLPGPAQVLPLPQQGRQDCVPQCVICPPKAIGPPCGVCGKTKIPVRPGSTPNAIKARSRVEKTEGEEGFVMIEKPQEEAAPQASEEPPQAAEESPKAAEEPPQDAAEPPPVAEEQPQADEDAQPPEEPQAKAGGEEAVKTDEEKKADSDCVCAAVQAKKKKSCMCPLPRAEDPEEDDCDCEADDSPPLCHCPPADQECQQMVRDLQEKLDSAQNEITEMQRDLDKLQRMDANKKVGPHATPNPAALYKEIMKDSAPTPVDTFEFQESVEASAPVCPCPVATPACPCGGGGQSDQYGDYQTSQSIPQAMGQSGNFVSMAGTVQDDTMSGMVSRSPPPKRICGPPSLVNSLRMQMSQMNSPYGPLPPMGPHSTPQLIPAFTNRMRGYSPQPMSPTRYPSVIHSATPSPNTMYSMYSSQIPSQFTGQSGQYAGQSGQYAGQSGQYAGQSGQYAGQSGQYAGRSVQYAGQSGQYAGQSGQCTGRSVQGSQSSGCGLNGCMPYGQSPDQSQMATSQSMRITSSFLQNADIVTCPTRYRGNRTQ